ncbi:glucose dehydrogenase [FAD, quinone]-like [Euwallacea fornicatus]|uniref:glucose dehydrogenase [FAD, quinone]-like n=1 Tax=Euwallacea fornicatus TaxID=995702 RepID=UPI00338F3D13
MVAVSSLVILIYVIAVYFFGIFLHYALLVSDVFYTFIPIEENEIFDYIVVGGGSAGSIIANRLAKNSKDTVLVLEAGKDISDLLHIPSVGILLQKTAYDWSYHTVPQKNACKGLNKNISLWPMGKVLGGTNMLNSLLYTRGHREDFDEWFRENEFYNYSDIMLYFKTLEQFDNAKGYSDSHKPMFISQLSFSTDLPTVLLKAAKHLGYPVIENNNLNCELGFDTPAANLFNGKRWTSAENLKEHLRINLFIKTNCLVEKIILKYNFEAKGVEYNFLGEKYRAFARKAVILSAGVIGSPKILMLSGIGPKNHLKSLGIPLVANLPVGNNLQDHVTTGFDLILLNHTLTLGIANILSPISMYEYFVKNSGPWTTTGCELMAFFNTKSKSSQLRPDLQFMVMPLGFTEDSGYFLRKLVGISDTTWSSYFAKINKKSLTILPILLHPKSKGTVRLQSKNPLIPPLIDPQYLTDPEDVEVLIRGIQIIKDLVKTQELQSFGAEFNNNTLTECHEYIFDTKEYWECYVRYLSVTAFHPVGTCKMGKHDDPTTVVDYNFQVKGLNKLYVMDGSVLPSLPSGNINGPILMLAEMAADYIRKTSYLSSKVCAMSEILVPKYIC